MSEKRIAKAVISAMPRTMFDPMPTVTVRYEDGKSEILFQYYPDEIRFTEDEFVGLTRSEAINLKFNRDRNYLRS